jgi:hypothetical protein
MSIMASIEQEFQNIIADARSIPEKLAALVGLHAKSQELAQLEEQITTIVNGGEAVETKVEGILHAVGKL